MKQCPSEGPTQLKIFVPMIPKPCQRTKHGKGFTYTPKETQDAKARIALFTQKKIEDQGIEWPMDGHYYSVLLGIYIPKPKNFWDDGSRCKPAFGGGDLDNHAKTVLDALQGILWTNDNRVTRIEVQKSFDEKSGYSIMATAWPIGDKPKKSKKKKEEA